MADIDREAIDNLTALCRIKCTEAEKESLYHDLVKILGYVDTLQKLDTSSVEPCYTTLGPEFRNVMREDEVGELLDRDTFLANAPSHIGGMIKVPPVINKQGEN